jgi:hypothetical protein
MTETTDSTVWLVYAISPVSGERLVSIRRTEVDAIRAMERAAFAQVGDASQRHGDLVRSTITGGVIYFAEPWEVRDE